MSSLSSIQNTIKTQNTKYYENLILNLAALDPEKKIVLCWTPAHVGLLANEKADIIAKKAIDSGVLLNIKLEPKEIIKILKDEIWLSWIEYYKRSTAEVGTFLASVLDNVPPKTPWFINTTLSHSNIRLINRLKTGHCFDGRFLYWMKAIETNLCNECDILDDFKHILFNCKKYQNIRNKYDIFKQNDAVKILKENNEKSFNDINIYLKEINKFL